MADPSPTPHRDQPLQIVLAEDSPSDAGLTLEALGRSSAPNTTHRTAGLPQAAGATRRCPNA